MILKDIVLQTILELSSDSEWNRNAQNSKSKMNGTLTLTRILRRVVLSTLTVLSTLLFMFPPIVMIMVDDMLMSN